ncbi:aldehyde dehydrogenase family protein [Cupriavidus consociatus]|uniref:aldehyde dehydrogenase family protein n=1 Tax=Cupriavidus consociatus TaxID=2821357 RepID=UPI001AE2DAB8|nr:MULTISPECIES: aldehyde dehydrogenase family protein [unclassified Cupriavidus]MBP0625273.1 aldehyde dehydrogenase [Cupriavidus sp. LEh25]MDK2662010.1 aldehyde dehydrogenase family protein [Cupriavidus sp. LEh21]
MTSTNELSLSETYGAFIDNEFRPVAGQTFPAKHAGTGETVAQLARCGRTEIDAAVQAAAKAAPAWRARSAEERAELLLKLAAVIEADTDRLARIDSIDIGRRLFETTLDHRFAISQYRYFAAAAITHEGFGRAIPNGYLVAKREPYGVCGLIIPWNVPAIMAAFKIAPAVAAGNTVVLKPDENASLSTMELCKHIARIFPPGVINVVPGFGEEAGAALTAHPGVAKLAFTGSSEVGRIISQAGAERLVPVSLELGGKSPNIVFPDIEDIDAVVDNAMFATMYCNGQSCLAGTRLFVHDAIYDDFMERLVAGMRRVKVGPALATDTIMSSLVSAEQGERVLKYIDIGISEGARLMVGGKRVSVEGNEAGYFIEPTVFEATNSMRIAQEEIFGPVLSVMRWSDYDQMIAEANGVRYGLAAGLYTSNLRNAWETADRLQAGSVWINQYFNLASGSPFGGFKESGIGSEYCHETLNMYTHLKAITVQTKVMEPWFAPKP